MLKVDGAGISLTDPEGRRVPLGASSEDASAAERLQFTTGGGPCMTAQETRQPVFAVEEDLLRRWPAFADLLLGGTPFRAVVALPLQPALAGDGAMDLFFTRADDVTDLDVFEALAVGELVTSALSEAAVWSAWTPAEGPEWLHGPLPRRRAAVWEAMGLLERRPRAHRARSARADAGARLRQRPLRRRRRRGPPRRPAAPGRAAGEGRLLSRSAARAR